MAINIKTKQTYIPVQLGDLELKYDLSDDAIARVRKVSKELIQEIENIDEDKLSEEETMIEIKGLLKEAYDILFGEGTFEKVYEMSPSTLIVQEYLVQIAEGVTEELKSRGYSKDN